MDQTTETVSSSDDVFEPLDHLWFVVHWALSAFILIGNSLTILAICRDYRLQTQANVYLLHLAVADCLVGVAVLISSFMYLEFSSRAFDENKYLCLSFFSLDYASAAQSQVMLTMMAVDRLVNIAYPFHYIRYFTEKVTKRIAMFSWLTALAAGALQLFNAKVSPAYGCTYYGQMHSVFDQIIVPCLIVGCIIVTTACYTVVACIARAQRRRVKADEAQYSCQVDGATALTQLSQSPRQSTDSNEQLRPTVAQQLRSTQIEQPVTGTDQRPRDTPNGRITSSKNISAANANGQAAVTSEVPDLHRNSPPMCTRKQKSLTLFVTVNSIFALCWMPFVIISFTENFSDVPDDIMDAAIFLSTANSGMNFVIYALRHKQFARAYRDLLGRCFCRKTSRSLETPSLS